MGTDARETIDSLNAQSWRLSNANPSRALELAHEAVDRSRAVGDNDREARSRLNCGWACVYLGRIEGALDHIYAARSMFEAIGDSESLSESLNALGVVAQRLLEPDLALEYYQLSLQAALDHPERRVAALNNLGELHEERDAQDDAARCFESAARLAEDHDLPAARAIIRCNQARVSLRRGDRSACRRQLDDALEESLALNDRVTEAEALRILGNLERSRVTTGEGNDEAAEDLYLRSIAIAEEGGMPDTKLRGMLRLFEMYIELGRTDEAALHAAFALETVTSYPQLLAVGDSVNKLCIMLEQSGDLSQAFDLLESLEVLRQSFDGAAGRRAQTLRHYHQLEQARLETKTIRERNEKLEGEWASLASENSMLYLLYRIGSEITASLDLAELSRVLYARVNEMMSADVFGLARYNSDEELLEFSEVIEQNQRLTPFVVPLDSRWSFGSWVVRNAQELILNDAKREFSEYITENRPFAEGDSQSVIFLPLKIEDHVIGVLTVQSYAMNAYAGEQIDFLRMLAPYLAIAMDNSQKMETIVGLHRRVNQEKKALEDAYEQINHMANHDTLTGLPNRRLVTELVTEHIHLAQRRDTLFGLLYLDLDQFKPINDTFGHGVGDTVLVQISNRLQRSVRQSDTVARLGGDEFLIVIREIAGEEALITIAEKIRVAVAEPVQVDTQRFELTASIGASVFPRHGSTFHELVTVADRAMYRSKQADNEFVSVG